MTVLFEPAEAIAAANCLAARSRPGGVGPRHPGRCGWCEYQADELVQLVDGFLQWADFNDRHGTAAHVDVAAFARLPREEQRRLVEQAAAFEEPGGTHRDAPGAAQPPSSPSPRDASEAIFSAEPAETPLPDGSSIAPEPDEAPVEVSWA